MTSTGEHRAQYARTMTNDPRPSRFTDPALYSEWAARADAWSPMSEWAESRRHLMTPDTIAANERLEAARRAQDQE